MDKVGRCLRLTTYHHPVPLSRNLGALTSWNPLGLSRPVTGLLYLFYLFNIVSLIFFWRNQVKHRILCRDQSPGSPEHTGVTLGNVLMCCKVIFGTVPIGKSYRETEEGST